MEESSHSIVRLLVVDDDTMLWAMLQEMLDEQEFQIRFASNGQEGLKAIAEQIPDLVLLDVLMPVMSGFDCLKVLRDDPKTQNLPIIMLTAMEYSETIDYAFAFGATDFIPKPIHWPLLAHRLRYVFRANAAYNRLLEVQRQKTNIIQASEKHFRQMANTSPAMIWITDTKGNPTFVNQTWLDFTGIDFQKALTYQGWANTVHPDDLNSILQLYSEKPQRNKTLLSEYRLRHVNGDWHWILDKGVALYNEEDQFEGYIGSAIDINERKKIEADLRIAATAFESQEGMLVSDANNNILRVNSAFTRITGYSPAEVIGKNPRILQSGRQDTVFYAEMWKHINETGTWEGEVWNRRKNGEIFPERLTITSVKDQNGLVTNYVATLFDITLSKAAADKIESLAFYIL